MPAPIVSQGAFGPPAGPVLAVWEQPKRPATLRPLSDPAMLVEHLRQFGLQPLGHRDGRLRCAGHVLPAGDAREKTERRQGVFLLLEEVRMQRVGDGARSLAGAAAGAGRPHQRLVEFVVLRLERLRNTGGHDASSSCGLHPGSRTAARPA